MALNAYRYRFYGGDSGAEQAFLLAMYAKGYTAASVMDATDQVLTGKGTTRIGVSASPVTVVNTTTRTALLTQTLGAAQAGDEFILTAWGDDTNSSGASVNYLLEIVLGSTTIATGTSARTNISTVGNRRRWWLETNILVVTTTTQDAGGIFTLSSPAAPTMSNFVFGTASTTAVFSNTTPTEDMTTSKDLSLFVTMAAAGATVDCRLGGYTVARRR